MMSRFPPFAFVELVSPYNKKNITRWLEAARTSEILFLPREHKIHIFSPPCNIYIISLLFCPFHFFFIYCIYVVFVIEIKRHEVSNPTTQQPCLTNNNVYLWFPGCRLVPSTPQSLFFFAEMTTEQPNS